MLNTLLLFLAVITWGLFHSLLASTGAKDLARKWMGERGVRFYRLGYNLFACASFIPVLVISFLFPDHTLYMVRMPWAGLMVFCEILAIAVLVIGFMQTDIIEFIGLRSTASPMEVRQGNLTTGGLYRYARHPLYTAGMVFIWMMPLMTVNVLTINTALTLYVIAGTIFEERKLRSSFGRAYIEYSARTPMFIPFTKWNKK